MGDVVEIGKAKFELRRLAYCAHDHLVYDLSGRTVQCKDCNRMIDGFEAFIIFLRNWEYGMAGLKSREQELSDLEKRVGKNLLKATRDVDQAWRSKSMVPTCPHCHEAIFPGDGFGTSHVNREMALQARRFKEKSK